MDSMLVLNKYYQQQNITHLQDIHSIKQCHCNYTMTQQYRQVLLNMQRGQRQIQWNHSYRIIIFMDNKFRLNLRGDQYKEMIEKFKSREEQTSLEEALVYLKLREFECENSRALIFAKKKQRGIDGTINKDGPPGFRKLDVLKSQSKLTNGWLRGQKLKYNGTTGYTQMLKKNQSAEKMSITKYHQKNRQYEQQLRRSRSKSTVTIDISKPRQSLEKISAMKEDASKQRQQRNMFIEFQGLKLDQTTKNFFKDSQQLDEQGLVVKLGAFSPMIADENLTLKVDSASLKTKFLGNNEIEGEKKRQRIIAYQKKLRQFTDEQLPDIKEQNKWKSLIQKKSNDEKQLLFNKKSLDAASNPLILMHTKDLKNDLAKSQKKCAENLTQYSNFYHSLEKAVKLQFLDKRRFTSTDLGFKKKSVGKESVERI